MRETTRISDKDLEFVRKYCLGGTFPASDQRCPYAKAKLLAGFPKVRMQCSSVDIQMKKCPYTKHV